MKPFLRLLAEAYHRNFPEGLSDLCFVFPTRRAAHFFLEYLSHLEPARKFAILPRALTMSEFCSSFTDRVQPSRFDELCILYNVYHALSEEIPDFDRFRFWGEMILDDFNHVDSSLADAEMLFRNVSEFREIRTDYLTDEQREIIERYWPESLPPKDSNAGFWLHHEHGAYNGPKSAVVGKFMKLWQVLGALYEGFNEEMKRNGLISSGQAVRGVAERLGQMSAADFESPLYVFAGFGLLSNAELKIFKRMQRLGIAHFYWDLPGSLVSMPENRPVRFIRRYQDDFPPAIDLNDFDVDTQLTPKVTIVGVPSATGQAALAGHTLRQWQGAGLIGKGPAAVNTAVVLADESLFTPLVHRLPDSITNINVTLGLPVRQTPVAALMRSIVSLQLRSRFVRDDYRFFYEDVMRLLHTPSVRSIDPECCDNAVRHMNANRVYTLTSAEAKELLPPLAPLFTAVKAVDNFSEVFDYIEGIVSFLTEHLDREDNSSRRLDMQFLRGYLQTVKSLRTTIATRGITVANTTALQLVERVVGSASIRFEGRPIEGLQITGMSDVRGLDFSNIILTSMNEKVYPKRSALRSFIPENIRRGYGLPTSDYVEGACSYNFFRLVARAYNVAVFYDSRSSGVGANEMSRYVSQLLYLGTIPGVRHLSASYTTDTFKPVSIEVDKHNPEVVERLNRFCSEGEDCRYLSASALNTYINCPLSFYLSYVADLRVEEDVVDFVDSSTYGKIVHQVTEDIYNELRGSRPKVLVTAEALKRIADNQAYLDRLITMAVNYHHNRTDRHDTTPLIGETRVLAGLIRHSVREMLRREMEMAPFSFVAAEFKRRGRYAVSPSLTVNTVMVIDRIDELAPGHLRFIDYKTGNDDLTFSSVDDLFDDPSASKERSKAVLQLMLYSHLYRAQQGFEGKIQPYIYRFKSIFTEGLPPIVYNKTVFDDDSVINSEFVDRLHEVIEEIFNPDVPFRQTDKLKKCTYCNFRQLCNREG